MTTPSGMGQQMVYGDGDGQLFKRFTLAIDVIGHELTHGVTQYTCKSDYSDQPGALNESLSDVFGSLVKQRQRRQTASQADWLIGEGLFTAERQGRRAPFIEGAWNGIRRSRARARTRSRLTCGTIVHTSDDDGGIHINSGIPNHAFFLVAAAIGGFAWEKAGMIWYTAARDKFTSQYRFCRRRQDDLPVRDGAVRNRQCRAACDSIRLGGSGRSRRRGATGA